MMQNSKRSLSGVGAAAVVAIAWGLGAGASVVNTMATAGAVESAPKSQATSAPSTAAARSPEGAQSTAAPASGAKLAVPKPELDRSGQKRTGKASFYADRYSGKTMADGTPMRPDSNNAASITLPLGTTAKVTNLATGRSAIVSIRDRGPYVRGRIVDLSPATARQIGLAPRQGLAKVEVAPVTIPLPDGTVKVMRNAVAMVSN